MTIHKSKGLEAPVVFVVGGTSAPRSDEARVYHEGGRRLAWVGEPSTAVKPLVRAEEREEDQRLVYVALTRAQGRLYAPCIVEDNGRPKKFRGAYDRMNRRVAELVASPGDLFSVEDVARPALGGGGVSGGDAASTFVPSLEWLSESASSARHEQLRRSHAGLVLTSYTRMKAGRGWSAGAAGATGAWTDPSRAAEEEAFAEHVDEGGGAALRSTRSTGVFLHELLERLPIESFADPGGFAAWRARGDVGVVVDEAMAVYRVDPSQREHAERLAWAAYTTATVLPDGGVLAGGLSSATRIAREMPFVFTKAPRGPASERVLIRGSIDLAFEREGRTYFVDWKSDSLRSYGPDAIARRVVDRYEGQLRLYAMAITRLLGIASADEYDRRFGGLLYCFLRGFGADGAGLYSLRPSWESMAEWATELEAWSPEGGA
jgi:exodeoxyribonuclease V beta subunit